MTTPLPNVRLVLSLTDLYALYAAARADGDGMIVDAPSPALASLLATLRGLWDADQRETMPDAPEWLRALALGEV